MLIENTHSYLIFIPNNYQRRKTAITDAKKIAATYNLLREKNIDSVEKLNEIISTVKAELKETHRSIRGIDEEITSLNETIKYLDHTHTNKAVWDKYINSGRSSSFYETHRADLMIYGSAATFLKKKHISPNSDPDTFRESAASLEEQRSCLYTNLQGLQKERKELDIIKQNVDIIMKNSKDKNKGDIPGYVNACLLLLECDLPDEIKTNYDQLVMRMPILQDAIDKFDEVYHADIDQFNEYFAPEALRVTATYLDYQAVAPSEKILGETRENVLMATKKLVQVVNEKIDEIYMFVTIETNAEARAVEDVMIRDGYVDSQYKIH